MDEITAFWPQKSLRFDMMVEIVSIMAAHGKEDNNDEVTAGRSIVFLPLTVAFIMLIASHFRAENDRAHFFAFSCLKLCFT